MAKFSTVAVLVHWPGENVNIYILTQRATPISCNNSLQKLKIPTLCSLLYSGGQILSISSADTILVKHHFPFTEEGTLFLALLRWIKVVIVLFSLLEISPVTHPQPKLLQNFPISISAS